MKSIVKKSKSRPNHCQKCGRSISPNFYVFIDNKWLCRNCSQKI